jgi:hypothetical protein
MFPNGTFARTADKVPEGCVLVEEPDLPEEVEVKIDDQSKAVREAISGQDDGS